MDKFIIRGGRRLKGHVKINGAKNSALAIICAAVIAEREVILENVPNILDVQVIIEIINSLGAEAGWIGIDNNVLKIIPPQVLKNHVPQQKVKKLRASSLLLGPLMARFGRIRLSLPGGCNIGVRPMDLHFKGLSKLGAELKLERGYVIADASGLRGEKIYLDFPSVGATENIMMAACLAEGQTVIENVAKEPEIVDLANFLNFLGARIRGAGTDVIKIEGVRELSGSGHYTIIPDRIEAGTFMLAAAITRGDVVLEKVIPLHLEPIVAKLREVGVEVIEEEDTLRVISKEPLNPIDIKTLPYPGFPTDMQSQMLALLATVKGTSIVVENIFENRFQVASELKRMGAQIKVEGRMAMIEGVPVLQGSQVKATDLRAGAALIIAALAAEGETEIANAYYVDRGYQNLEEKLRALGADIKRA